MVAYDNVDLKKLIQIVIGQKILPQIIEFISNLVQERSLTAYYKNVKFNTAQRTETYIK